MSELMTKHEIPCDAIWLDIEYTDSKKYFTWDQETFPEAKKMLETLEKEGRKLVTIIDPHIKKDDDYFVYKDLLAKKLLVMDSTGEQEYVGACWPGTSSWVDFMNPEAREYIKSLYTQVPENCEDAKNYIWTSPNVHIWNDMNEPACFDPYEKTMSKANIHKFGSS